MINYFGTNDTSAGNYWWEINEHSMQNIGLFPPLSTHPEEMVNTGTPFGEVKYFEQDGFNFCAISGAPHDTRGGTKSVFWVKEKPDNWRKFLTANQVCKRLIDKMPFQIKW